jgi:hypothetical protein
MLFFRGPSFLVGLFTVAFICGAGLSPVLAQQKHDPDDEFIENMARAGVRFLEATSKNINGDQLVLAALTINEVSKRYDRVIPKEHPLVQAAINQILAALENSGGDDNSGGRGSGGLKEHTSIYYPALALIVLCDVDDNLYRDQIIELIDNLVERQQPNGSFNYLHISRRDNTIGDISQTQYACLALFVAKHHGFRIDPEVPKKILQWLVDNQVSGSWYYHTKDGRAESKIANEKTLTLSRHCCGLGATYLLSDMLQLNPRVRGGKSENKTAGRGGLPPSVSVYVKPKNADPEQAAKEDKTGPLVQFNGSGLASCKNQGNQWLKQNFAIETPMWNYYYLYGLERYAYFREVADGEVSEVPNWYDQGVEFLVTRQSRDSGGFEMGANGLEGERVATCLSVLFLVRSSEVLILPMNSSLLRGGEGFASNVVLKGDNGQIRSQAAVKSIEDVMSLLEEDTSDEQLQVLADAMDDAIKQFSNDGNKSRGENLAFLTGLVKDRNFFRRMVAVKILAREPSMDNVPALIYALGDPDVRVCKEAHDGLRLISRKVDAFQLPARPTLDDYKMVKRQWTEWFLQIRPGAQLID